MKILCYLLLIFSSFASITFAEEAPKPATSPTTERSTLDAWKSEIETSKKEQVEESRFGELFVRMILMLLITLALLVLAAWASKRFLQSRMIAGSTSSRIQILERKALSPKSGLYLVRIDGHELLVCEFANGVQLMKEMPPSQGSV